MALTGATGDQVETAFAEADELLSRTAGRSAIHFHRQVYVLIKLWAAGKPVIGLETGMAYGASTIFLLHALPAGSTLFTVECCYQDADHMRRSLSTINIPTPDAVTWEPLAGKSQEVLPELAVTLDFFLHDSDHSPEHQKFEYRWALGHLRSGGLLLSDDIHWGGPEAWQMAMNAINADGYYQVGHLGALVKP